MQQSEREIRKKMSWEVNNKQHTKQLISTRRNSPYIVKFVSYFNRQGGSLARSYSKHTPYYFRASRFEQLKNTRSRVIRPFIIGSSELEKWKTTKATSFAVVTQLPKVFFTIIDLAGDSNSTFCFPVLCTLREKEETELIQCRKNAVI